jgi:hypothetical protein
MGLTSVAGLTAEGSQTSELGLTSVADRTSVKAGRRDG